MKITIKRVFSRVRQIADFVPVRAECEATVEFEVDPIKTPEYKDSMEIHSAALDQFVQSEVEKTLMGYTPSCIRCGGKALFPKKVLNKEGMCAQCVSELSFQAKDFRADNEKNARTNTAPKTPESGTQGRNYRKI
jgi:hypothetical protein